MRKIFVILVVSTLLMAALVPSALAEPKPATGQIPMRMDPTDPDPGFAYWIELDPAQGGPGIELPGGPAFIDFDEDVIRGGPVGDWQHGLPIGFDFHYMGGPATGVPVWDWVDHDNNNATPDIWQVVAYVDQLSDMGYDEVYVALNGYIVFDTFRPYFPPGERPVGEFAGLGTRVFEVNDLPTPEFPNNYIAPFFTDLTISDNDFEEVTGVAFVCDENPTEACVDCNCQNGIDDGACHQSSPFSCEDGAGDPDPSGHWEPCECKIVHRPRGRLLYATVGDEPERKFVVEWLNAKNVWTGNIATFQVQLWEEGNKILFLYHDFKTKAFWEDPPHDTAYVLNPALVVGLEDFFGQAGVGQAWAPALRYGTWELFNPFDEGDAWGFCVPAYDADDCAIDPWQ